MLLLYIFCFLPNRYPNIGLLLKWILLLVHTNDFWRSFWTIDTKYHELLHIHRVEEVDDDIAYRVLTRLIS
jgi:hypothetical protein